MTSRFPHQVSPTSSTTISRPPFVKFRAVTPPP
jgi:hypothetical protein